MELITIANVVLAAFTGALVFVTMKLSQHTRTLADLTRQLVLIEQQREERAKAQQRRLQIRGGLDLTEALQKSNPQEFPKKIREKAFIDVEKNIFRELSLLTNLIDDPECIDLIDYLRKTLDLPYAAMLERIAIVEGKLIDLQGKIGKSILDWRKELGGLTVPPPTGGYGTGYGENYGAQL